MAMILGQTIQVNQRGFIILIILALGTLFIFHRFGSNNDEGRHDKSQIFNQLINLRDVLSASIDAAKRGGQQVYDIRKSVAMKIKSKGKTNEGANDPVTDGDMLSHIEMFNSLKNAFPTISIVSEEKPSHYHDSDVLPAVINSHELKDLKKTSSEIVKAQDVQVWIDPLDATQEYTENLLQYVTTMVCVAVKGVPVIGVIHKPFENFTAWAWVGHGYSKKLEVKNDKNGHPGSPVKVIVSRSHTGEVIAQAQKAFGKDVEVTTAGGAGYKILEVISGRQDVYFHSTLIKKWDICAGNAILNHFNYGRLTTIQGFEIDYSSPTDYKNPDGLVASLYNHNYYLKKLS